MFQSRFCLIPGRRNHIPPKAVPASLECCQQERSPVPHSTGFGAFQKKHRIPGNVSHRIKNHAPCTRVKLIGGQRGKKPGANFIHVYRKNIQSLRLLHPNWSAHKSANCLSNETPIRSTNTQSFTHTQTQVWKNNPLPA